MKGQHTVLREVFLFALGVAITSFVVLSFTNVQTASQNLALRDQMLKVADLVSGSVVHVAEVGENASIGIEIPEKIAEKIYRIRLGDDRVTVALLDDPAVNITKKIFNITSSYVMSGEVISTGRFFEVTTENRNIRIRRALG